LRRADKYGDATMPFADFRRHARLARTLLAIASLAFLPACGWSRVAQVHYRLTFDIALNGETKSASSLIDLDFVWGADASGKSTIITFTRGSAALIDLGRSGTLVAAVIGDWTEWRTRSRTLGLRCPAPQAASMIFEKAARFPDRFVRSKVELLSLIENLRPGQHKLTDDQLPAFLWFPAGASYKEGKQICPEEFSRVIGANVALRSVSIEMLRDGSASPWVRPPPPWLVEIRNDKDNGSSSGRERVKPQRGQIETSFCLPGETCRDWR